MTWHRKGVPWQTRAKHELIWWKCRTRDWFCTAILRRSCKNCGRTLTERGPYACPDCAGDAWEPRTCSVCAWFNHCQARGWWLWAMRVVFRHRAFFCPGFVHRVGRRVYRAC